MTKKPRTVRTGKSGLHTQERTKNHFHARRLRKGVRFVRDTNSRTVRTPFSKSVSVFDTPNAEASQ